MHTSGRCVAAGTRKEVSEWCVRQNCPLGWDVGCSGELPVALEHGKGWSEQCVHGLNRGIVASHGTVIKRTYLVPEVDSRAWIEI